MLAEIYNSFTKGFDTGDLKDGKGVAWRAGYLALVAQSGSASIGSVGEGADWASWLLTAANRQLPIEVLTARSADRIGVRLRMQRSSCTQPQN